MTPFNFIAMSALYWYVVFTIFVTYSLAKALYFKFCSSLSEYYEHYYSEDNYNNYNNHNDNTENV
jgi:hypothetical protein